MKVKVTIIGPATAYQKHLAMVIAGANGFAVVGSHSALKPALSAATAEKPDVLLFGDELPNRSSVNWLCKSTSRFQGLKIVLLIERNDRTRLVDALTCGVTGYVVKPAKDTEVLRAIAEVYQGCFVISTSRLGFVVGSREAATVDGKEIETLTRRETEILRHLAQDLLYKEIAERLKISIHTVRVHVNNIYQKLHVHSRAAARAKYLGSPGSAKY